MAGGVTGHSEKKLSLVSGPTPSDWGWREGLALLSVTKQALGVSVSPS